jgi:PEP-CTERM motif
MFSNRFVTPVLAIGVSVVALCVASSAIAAVAPIALPPGATVTSLPNGGSSYPGDEGVTVFDDFIDFDFGDGLLSGVLRERVLKYSQVNEFHPYGGFYFDYEITLTSGDISAFGVLGYAPLEVAVKQCGVADCGGSGANGELTSAATRSTDGDEITYFFDGDLVGGTHSANLQLLTNASSFADPPATFENAAGDVFSLAIVGPAPVPEPSTWAMLVIGFAGLTALGWRGSRRAASHAT